MIIRYVHRPLAALGVAYILSASVPAHSLHMAELHLASSAPEQSREVSRRTVASLFASLALTGFSLIIFGPTFRGVGFVLTFVAGAISMIAGFGQMLGFWEWAEYRERLEAREDRARLERVLGALEAPLSGQDGINDVVYDKTGATVLNTKYGPMTTTRTADGYRIQLGDEEKGKEVGLVRVQGDGVVHSDWQDQATGLLRGGDETERFAVLLEAYR